ncbi:hypothetical protein GGF32_006731 [Allomyces javanicus]|nr:hypothetical protein GGF32_006731 [Allomyces javanicus]
MGLFTILAVPVVWGFRALWSSNKYTEPPTTPSQPPPKEEKPIVSAPMATFQLVTSVLGLVMDTLTLLTLRPSAVTSSLLDSAQARARALFPDLVYTGTPIIPAVYWTYFGLLIGAVVFNWGASIGLVANRLRRNNRKNRFNQWFHDPEPIGIKWMTALILVLCGASVANLSILQCRAFGWVSLSAPIERDGFWRDLTRFGVLQAIANLAKLGLQIFFRVQFSNLWPLITQANLMFSSWSNAITITTIVFSSITTLVNLLVTVLTLVSRPPPEYDEIEPPAPTPPPSRLQEAVQRIEGYFGWVRGQDG